MKFSAVFLSALFTTAIAAPTVRDVVKRQAQPDQSQVYIISAVPRGSGCPGESSASINISSDRKAVTILLDQYIAEIGPGLPLSGARKNCQINLNMHYPQGFQYSVLSSDYRGYIRLDRGVSATQRANYYFSGESSGDAATQTTLNGPIDQNYLISDDIPFTSTVWAPCGRVAALNINSEVRVNNSGNRQGAGIITTDSVDLKVEYIVGVQWRRC